MAKPKNNERHERHKRILKDKGYTYRSAAPHLEVDFSHLNRVLNGKRVSKSLLKRIEVLADQKEVTK